MSADLRAPLRAYLDAQPRPGRALDAAQAEAGQQARRQLLAAGAAAVPVLLDGLGRPDFADKDACYDLLLEIGPAARPALAAQWGARGPVLDIWIAALLRHLGDDGALDRLWPQLRHADPQVRHLSALALALPLLRAPPPVRAPAELVDALVDALSDARGIEGTPATIAGSALACLQHLSGRDLLAPPRVVQLYNDEHFLYPPPEHPFPFAADHFTQATPAEQQAIRARIEAWRAGRPP